MVQGRWVIKKTSIPSTLTNSILRAPHEKKKMNEKLAEINPLSLKKVQGRQSKKKNYTSPRLAQRQLSFVGRLARDGRITPKIVRGCVGLGVIRSAPLRGMKTKVS